jgi:hypothetical protein
VTVSAVAEDTGKLKGYGPVEFVQVNVADVAVPVTVAKATTGDSSKAHIRTILFTIIRILSVARSSQ